MADLSLHTYQEEVVQRPLQGENVIIWLPTGSGKTRAAVYVAKRHLETTANAKVVVLVNMIHLVEQHYNNEFKPHLGRDYDLVPVSGDSVEKDFFGRVVQDAEVVICTAQILHNAMTATEESKRVELSDITLLIIDECHHTHKEHVYNKIMRCYVEKKLQGERRLPQILGLTASPGTGNAKILDKAVEHVLQVCANMDSAIVQTERHVTELKERVRRPTKTFDIVDQRPQDPFGDHVKRIMQLIHDFMQLPRDFNLRKYGTQEYEADVVILNERGVREDNRMWAQCALHLRQYNDALLINDTLRMVDAFRSLDAFYRTKVNTAIDGTDHYLLALFQENKAQLRTVAEDARYENPKMFKLESVLLQQFGPATESRAILFSKTRKSTHCLLDWVSTNGALQGAGIKAAILTGSGIGLSHMTQNEQKDTIRNFRQGHLNLLISTSVAEEGLDIPQCNLVVRYGLLTNEIAQKQAVGRARAKDSRYSVVAQEGGKELCRERVNDHLEVLTDTAVAKIQEMSSAEFRSKIAKLQRNGMIERQLAESRKAEKRLSNAAAKVGLLCRNCFRPVAFGSDIRLIDNEHYVNVNPDFRRHYKVGAQVTLDKTFEDWEPGCQVLCSNGNCNMHWGHEMKYKKVVLLPRLVIKNFALETPEGRQTPKKWKNVNFTVEPFSFEEYCQDNFQDLFD
ncbi:ATP-dependent RNA helicase DHX58 [Nelusetta ayraudi]|uniref:ATP-dependent RNA helicase DHX58 n=1 Tax=Nelusetta ayraudi TaxID=303726 RepID=UPI003F6FA95D